MSSSSSSTSVVVNQRELKRAQHLVLARGIEQARGDDRPTCARGRRHARAGLAQEGHAVAAKAQVADDRAGWRVAALDIALRVLGQPDRHQPPAQLLAVAPAQHRHRGARRIRPRTAGVGEVSYRDGPHMAIIARTRSTAGRYAPAAVSAAAETASRNACCTLVWRPCAADIAKEMGRTYVIAPLAVACLLLAACGSSTTSSGHTSATAPAYVAAGNAICSRELARINRLTRPTTPEQAVSYLPQALSIMQRETRELAALDPPAPERAPLASSLAATRRLSALLHGFLRELRGGLVEISAFARAQSQSGALRSAIDAHFRQAGLSACAQ